MIVEQRKLSVYPITISEIKRYKSFQSYGLTQGYKKVELCIIHIIFNSFSFKNDGSTRFEIIGNRFS